MVVVAILPSDIYLTRTWSSYLDVVRTERASRKGGVIAFEDSPLSRHPYDLLVEAWILPSQSLALRAKRGDGIIAPPKDFKSWQPFPPAEPPIPRQVHLARLACRPCRRRLPIEAWSCCCGRWRVNATIACRGLFWDGSSFLANILDLGQVHDF